MQVVVNADDFGHSPAVNEAIARGHREGVVSSATLLVNAPGTADAVAMAKDLPRLGVGVHLALTETEPLTRCPHLAPGGRFAHSHAVVQARILAGLVPQQELRDEVRAQVDAACRTGLAIDHLDGHGHVHVLPGVLDVVLEACAEFGVTALRWPVEPRWVGGGVKAALKRRLIASWCRRGARAAAHLRRPTCMFGLAWSGNLTAERLLRIVAHLPEGVSEVMVHPALEDEAAYPGYHGAAELAAVCDPRVAAALPQRVTFGDLSQPSWVATAAIGAP
ncbi:MAG: ChbG/HpnK family deacetylase [Armatimonadetes bacterium]|nr:ChbG/HpnK family deacetylase [Armatimonadota bacterium]